MNEQEGLSGLSPRELLAVLIDDPPTEGDLRMLMELRVGLHADSSGPAEVIADPAPKPLDPEADALLQRLARERLRRLRLDRPRTDDPDTEDP